MELVKNFNVLILIFLFKCSSCDDSSQSYKKPTILIVTLIRNKAHTLPVFLSYLEAQDYPKNRLSLWMVTDHNEDNSQEILEVWLQRARSFYHSVHYKVDDSEKIQKGETSSTHGPEERFLELIRMKEDALEFGRQSWADFVFVS